MKPSTGKLSIRCLEVDAQYRLEFDGMDWSESFPSIEAAVRRASILVVEETTITVYDRAGNGVEIATVFPAAEATRAEAEPSAAHPTVELRQVLVTKGVRGAVQYLNSLTPYRFTSLYRFDAETLRSITFYDRENPSQESTEDIPVEASYCVFVRDSGQAVTIPDSGADARVKDHPKREVVKLYCGVPLLDGAGRMFGSLCHFDFEPGRIEPQDVELLERMATLLRPGL